MMQLLVMYAAERCKILIPLMAIAAIFEMMQLHIRVPAYRALMGMA